VWSDYGIVLSGPIGQPLAHGLNRPTFAGSLGSPSCHGRGFTILDWTLRAVLVGMLREIDN
jgi:hypothetical protein